MVRIIWCWRAARGCEWDREVLRGAAPCSSAGTGTCTFPSYNGSVPVKSVAAFEDQALSQQLFPDFPRPWPYHPSRRALCIPEPRAKAGKEEFRNMWDRNGWTHTESFGQDKEPPLHWEVAQPGGRGRMQVPFPSCGPGSSRTRVLRAGLRAGKAPLCPHCGWEQPP